MKMNIEIDLSETKEQKKAVHTCSVCGKVEFWGDSWEWYGAYKDLDENRPIFKTCSAECKKESKNAL